MSVKGSLSIVQESAVRADVMADQDASTLGYRQMQETDHMSDRSENNPLKNQGFWASPWSIKVKILRQLVDWNRESHFACGECRARSDGCAARSI